LEAYSVPLSEIAEDVCSLTQIFGPSGHEDSVIDEFSRRLRKLGCHPVTDPLGNVITRVRPADPGWPTIAISAHLDEVGFIVREVGPGWLRLHRVGGAHEKVLAGQLLHFRNHAGDIIEGHVSTTSAHLSSPDERMSATRTEDAYVDLLMSSAGEVAEAGLSPGTPGVFAGPFQRRGSLVRAKALDDRAGLAVLLALLRDLSAIPIGPGLTVIGTVQEEFTVRGGLPAVSAVRPDVLICIDIDPAPSLADEAAGPRIGQGPVLRHYSRGRSGAGLIPNPRLTEFITQAAASHAIRLAHGTLDGGLTDASYMQYTGAGIAAIDLAFPVRNAHTPVEVADLQDLRLLADLLRAVLASLQKGAAFARG
jgi:putative aminopeptidase